ncbi:MAG: CPBP family intramembrane metalloprotease [Planctomycetaceae bacterium]|nr:CPBP family intramembrane metalloprotease [Planctomycetaceae bacterium]
MSEQESEPVQETVEEIETGDITVETSADPVLPDLTEANRNFLGTAYRIQVGMILIALAIGGFLTTPPWKLFEWSQPALLLGTLGTLPLALFMLFLELLPFEGLRRIQDLLVHKVAPLVADATVKKLFVLALLVGVGEELIFRGIVQNFLMVHIDVHLAILISSIIFAFCHFISPTYIILVFGISLYLGYSSIWFSNNAEMNLVPPILIHTFYDFFAFLYILHKYKVKLREEEERTKT